MSGLILIGFNLALIAISLVFFIFAGLNVPLILFDKALYVFDIVSGGDLVKSILFGKEWTLNSSFFAIYITISIISLITIFIVFITKTTKNSFGFGNYEKEKKRSIFFWLLSFICSIALMPIIFFAINFLTNGLSNLFTYGTITETSTITIDNVKDTIVFNTNEINNYLNNLQKYKDYLINNKDIYINQFDKDVINEMISKLDKHINDLINLKNQLGNLNINNNLSDEQVENIGSINKKLTSFIFEIEETFSKININSSFNVGNQEYSLMENYNSLFDQYGSKLRILKVQNHITNNKNNTFDEIYYFFNKSDFKVQKITLDLSEIIFGVRAYNLFDPIFTFSIGSLADIFGNGFGFWVVKIFISFPLLSIISTTILMITLGLFIRVIKILYLLISSPFVVAYGINDNGFKFSIWLKKVITSFTYVIIATIAFSIYKISIPMIINIAKNDLVKTNWGSKIFNTDLQVVLLLVILLSILGFTYGCKKVIEISSELIGETKLSDNKLASGGTKIFNKSTSEFSRQSQRGLNSKTSKSFLDSKFDAKNIATKIGGK